MGRHYGRRQRWVCLFNTTASQSGKSCWGWLSTWTRPAKVVSAFQAGDIQFLDMRNLKAAYLTIDAHRGSLTSLVVHRHAPLVASGSSKQLIKVFNLEGHEQLGTIRYSSTYSSFFFLSIPWNSYLVL